jgi:crossover junction endodeoxyribonuclease RuvC
MTAVLQIKKLYLGIDPGKSGAIAEIDENGKIVDVIDFTNAFDMVEILYNASLFDCSAVLEAVHAMPKQGVKSMFEFGRNVGMWQGLLTAFKIPYVEIRPQKWQQAVGVMKRDGSDIKEAARMTARKYWPDYDGLKRKKDSGRADALLMALYCMWLDKKGTL